MGTKLYAVLTANNYDDSIVMSKLFSTRDAAFHHMVEAFRDELANCDIDWDIPDGVANFYKEDDGCIGRFDNKGYSITHDYDHNYACIVQVPDFWSDDES